MQSALRDLLTETLTIAPFLSRDEWGATTYGTPVTVPCRIEERTQIVMGASGPLRVMETKVWVDGATVVNQRSHVTFADGTVAPIQAMETWRDELGNLDHFVLFF
jgi:hypothetical protein